MQARGYIYMISFSAIVASSCKKIYSPAAITQSYDYLVVEGVISAGGGVDCEGDVTGCFR